MVLPLQLFEFPSEIPVRRQQLAYVHECPPDRDVDVDRAPNGEQMESQRNPNLDSVSRPI